MKQNFLLVVALAVLVGLSSALPTDNVDCSQLEAVIDDLGAVQGMTTLSDKHKMATTVEEMEKMCAASPEALKTLRKYNKECHTALTQQVFSAVLRTRQQFIEEHCKAGTDLFKQSIEAMKCIKENAFDAMKDAETKTVQTSQVLFESDIKDEKERIKRACCGVLDGKKIFMDAAKSKCGAYEKMYSDYVDSYTSESLGLICPDTEKLEKDGSCKQLTPLKIDGVPLKYVSFLNPMLKIVKTLDH